MECIYCLRQCKNKNSLAQHQIRCKLNPNKLDIISSFIDYNKKVKLGLIKKLKTNQFTKAALEGYQITVSDSTRAKISEACKKRIYSTEYSLKMSKIMKDVVKKYPESYSSANVNGRVKKIKYNGITLDGNWELLVVEWFDANNINWIRNTTGFSYEYNGSRTYYPDFYLLDYDLYVEVKGYQRDNDQFKWNAVSNLIIIKKNEISKIKNNTFKLCH